VTFYFLSYSAEQHLRRHAGGTFSPEMLSLRLLAAFRGTREDLVRTIRLAERVGEADIASALRAQLPAKCTTGDGSLTHAVHCPLVHVDDLPNCTVCGLPWCDRSFDGEAPCNQ
jgi:hypothetical protein